MEVGQSHQASGSWSSHWSWRRVPPLQPPRRFGYIWECWGPHRYRGGVRTDLQVAGTECDGGISQTWSGCSHLHTKELQLRPEIFLPSEDFFPIKLSLKTEKYINCLDDLTKVSCLSPEILSILVPQPAESMFRSAVHHHFVIQDRLWPRTMM